MSECPSIEELQANASDATPELAAHVAECPACQRIMALLFTRESAGSTAVACENVEPLLAIRGELDPEERRVLQEHLDECALCAQLVATEDTTTDSRTHRASVGPLEDAFDRLRVIERSDYAIGEELARGGMGRILEAEDKRLGRMVAVKELLWCDPESRQRFKREALVTAGLQHPAIVPVYEAGRWPDGEPFYAMKRVEGRSLGDLIEAAGTESDRIALVPNVLAVTDAIAYAHSKRVIHRDLKPSNVLVGEFGETVVIDWGLAKDLADDRKDALPAGPFRAGKEDLTMAGSVVGTPLYMSPEQAGGKPVDERTDVYALGAILYHVLAGVAPYRGTSRDEVLAKVLDTPPTPLGELAPRAPRDLVTIVDKAMARDPAERYPTAKELAEDLQRFQTGRLVAAHEYTRAQLLRRWLRRNRTVVAVSTILLLLLVATGIYSFARIIRERDLASDRQAAAEQERGRADRTSLALLAEQGRRELLADRPDNALVYLSAAYSRGDHSAATRYRLADATRRYDSVLAAWQSDAGTIRMFSHDGKRVVAVNDDFSAAEIRDTDGGRLIVRFEAERSAFLGQRLSPDGNRLLTTGPDGKPRLWDASRGAVVLTIETKASEEGGAFFTSEPNRILSFGADAIRWWAADTGALVKEVRPSRSSFAQGAISLDLSRFLTIRADGVAEVWELRTGHRVSILDNGSTELVLPWGMFRGMSPFSADGDRVLASTAEGAVLVWDADTGKRRLAFDAHMGKVLSACFSPDRRRLLTSGVDGLVRIWDAATGELLRGYEGSKGPKAAYYAAGGELVAVSELGFERVELLESTTLTRLGRYEGLAFALSSDGEMLGLGGAGPQIVRARSGRLYRVWPFSAPAREIYNLFYSLDDTRVIAIYADGSFDVWDADEGNLLVAWPEKDDADAGAPTTAEGETTPWTGSVSPTGHHMLVAVADRPAELREIESGAVIARIGQANDSVTSAAFSKDGALVLVGTTRGNAALYQTTDGTLGARFQGGHIAAGVSRVSRRAITVDENGRATLWKLDGTKIADCAVGDSRVEYAEFSPDGSRVVLFVTTGAEKYIGFDLLAAMTKQATLWDAESGKLLASLGPTVGPYVAFDKTGATVAASTATWDTETGALRVVLPESRKAEEWKRLLSFPSMAPDGTRWATGLFASPSIRDPATGRAIAILEERSSRILGSQFTPDGAFLATIDMHSFAKLWDASTGRQLDSFPLPWKELESEIGSGQWEVSRSNLGFALSHDGSRLSAASGGPPGGAVWSYDLSVEQRSPEEIAELVARNVPLRLEEGTVVPVEEPGQSKRDDPEVPSPATALLGPGDPPQVILEEAGSGKKRALRLSPAEGARADYDLVFRSARKLEVDSGGESHLPEPQPLEIGLSATVVAVEPDIRLELEVTRAQWPQFPSGEVGPVPGLVGTRAEVVLSPRGLVRSVVVPPPADGSGVLRQAFEWLAHSFVALSPALPDEAVGVGAKWRVVRPLARDGVRLQQTAQYELTSVDGERVEIHTTITEDANPQECEPLYLDGTPVALHAYESSGTGKGILDLGSALPQTADVSTASELRVTIDRGRRKDVHLFLQNGKQRWKLDRTFELRRH